MHLAKTEKTKDALDEHIIERCRRGDHDALRRVFEHHAPSLERTLRLLLGPRSELEDVLQETFISASRSFSRFRGEAQVGTWLRQIAVRRAIDFLRGPQSRRTSPLLVVADARQGADDRTITRQRLRRVYDHLEKVAPKKRVAFVLHVFEGRSVDEVAALTGASRVATKSRILFARRDLLRRAKTDPILREYLDESK